MKSKSVEVGDYQQQKEGMRALRYGMADCLGSGIPIFIPHPHREWEYSGALQACIETFNGVPIEAIDIGCGNSPLGVALTSIGATVTEIDPDVRLEALRKPTPNRHFKVGDLLTHSTDKQYDAVFCMSVIEHIYTKDQPVAWKRLADLVKPGGLLFVTTDFGLDRTIPWIADTERVHKFDPERVREVAALLEDERFTLDLDSTFHGPQVFDYTFFRWVAHAAL